MARGLARWRASKAEVRISITSANRGRLAALRCLARGRRGAQSPRQSPPRRKDAAEIVGALPPSHDWPTLHHSTLPL